MSKNDQESFAVKILDVSPDALNTDYCGNWLLKQYLPAAKQQLENGTVTQKVVSGLKSLAQASSFPEVRESSSQLLASLQAR